jgi:hypothetical protein
VAHSNSHAQAIAKAHLLPICCQKSVKQCLNEQVKPVELPRKINNLQHLPTVPKGFADLSLGPLGYRAIPDNSATCHSTTFYDQLAAKFAAIFKPSAKVSENAATPHLPPAARLPLTCGCTVSLL